MGMTDANNERLTQLYDFINAECGENVSVDTMLGLRCMDVQSLDELNELIDKFDSVGDNESEALQAAFSKWEFIEGGKAGTCLNCGSTSVAMEPMLDNEVSGECNDCGAGWVEIYELVGVRYK